MPDTYCAVGKSRHGGTQHGPKDKANREWAMKSREPELYLATKEIGVIKSLLVFTSSLWAF